MLASLNLFSLLTIAILALAFGDRTIRAVATVILLGVLSTIFVQRISRSYAPGMLLSMVDFFMVGAFVLVAVNSNRRWCWLIVGIQFAIALISSTRAIGLIAEQRFYLNLIAAATYMHVLTIVYALFDRYFGDPISPPDATPQSE